MVSTAPENFDRLAFNGSAIGNPSPAFAVESQKLSMANALGANSLRPLTDSSLACPPLPQYGTRSVAEVQQILSSIDTNTTPRELAQAGIIQLSDAVRKEMLQQPEGLTLPEAKSATVNDLSLVFTTSAKDDLVNKTDNPPADYFIGKDGSITMLTDPSKVESDHKLVFALEGDGSDQSKLPDPQRLSLNLLSQFLVTHYRDPQGGPLAIHDNGLIAPAIKQALGVQDDQVADQTQQQTDRYKQLASNDHSYISPKQADDYTPAGDSKYQYGDQKVQSIENATAGFNTGGHSEGQYTAVHDFKDRGWSAGRYPLTYDMFLAWLCDLCPLPGFGPEDILAKDKVEREKMIKALIERLRKDGKLTPAIAENLQSPGFQNLMERLQQGGKLTPEAAKALKSDIEKYLPSSLQELIGTGLINDFSKQLKAQKGSVDPGEVSLAMLFGHLPTDAELKQTKYKELYDQMKSANELAYQHLQNPKEGIYAYHVTGDPASPMAFKLASHFMDHAKTTEPGGYCAGKLSSSMGAVGLDKWRNDAPQMAQAMLRSREWVAINPDKAAPGDVVYRPHSSGRGGHIEGIAAVGPQGYLLASDFHHTLTNLRDNNNGYYSGLTVMRYVGPGGAKALSSQS